MGGMTTMPGAATIPGEPTGAGQAPYPQGLQLQPITAVESAAKTATNATACQNRQETNIPFLRSLWEETRLAPDAIGQ